MATKNIRTVGYLPPEYHQKLREYMLRESLSESGALVKIIKQFFEGPPASNPMPANQQTDETVTALKLKVAELEKRLLTVETALGSAKFSQTSSRSVTVPRGPLPKLPPQTSAELARRFGVSREWVEDASFKGEEYFKSWSKRRDPAAKAWVKREDLYYPLND